MLPNIESTKVAGGAGAVRPSATEGVAAKSATGMFVKAYRASIEAVSPRKDVSTTRTDQRPSSPLDSLQVGNRTIDSSSLLGRVDRLDPKTKTMGKDRQEFNLTVSYEERDALYNAFAPEMAGSSLSDAEMETLKKVTERITKFIDAAMAKSSENREKVEKAVGEWYSMIVNDKPRSPTELIRLLREASMGNLESPFLQFGGGTRRSEIVEEIILEEEIIREEEAISSLMEATPDSNDGVSTGMDEIVNSKR